jgi:hypothetical protein
MAAKRKLLPDTAGASASSKQERGRKTKKSSNEKEKDSADRVQVAFRMDKGAYRELKRMALDEDTTVNELMVRAINELRERRGLQKLSD